MSFNSWISRENHIVHFLEFVTMSLAAWLQGGTPSKKRKVPVENESEIDSPKRKFKKLNSQNSYDWYVKDDSGLWHCSLCRTAKFDSPYARGHEIAAKTTNHDRHAACKYL